MICSKLDAAMTNDDEDSPDPLTQTNNSAMTLMECNVCWKIVHPQCLRESYPQLPHEGIINNDMPNSWECPKCCDIEGPKIAKVFLVLRNLKFCFFSVVSVVFPR